MKVILSYGLGVDSTAILVRWLTEPQSRTFDLSDLIVVIAQTGDEWLETGYLVETHVFPLLAEHGVRTVQVARASSTQRDGIVILDDSRAPTTCHIGGAYALSDEMFAVATVPQTGGLRLCSLKAKGWALDVLIAQLTGGEEFIHVVGFEANESKRMMRDQPLGLPGRIPSYPLIEWGWDRAAAEWFLWDHFKLWWPKSACVMCPYALATAAGLARTLPRLVAAPYEAWKPLTMEYLAVAVNPRQGLIAGRQLYDELLTVDGGPELLAAFEEHLNCMPWAVYDVRRAFRAHPDDMMRPANAARSLTRLAEGDRSQMLTRLHELADGHGVPVTSDGRHHRAWLRERNIYYPCVEHSLVVAPALAADKTNKSFSDAWQAGLAGPAQLALTV